MCKFKTKSKEQAKEIERLGAVTERLGAVTERLGDNVAELERRVEAISVLLASETRARKNALEGAEREIAGYKEIIHEWLNGEEKGERE